MSASLALLRAVRAGDEDFGATLGELCDRGVLQELVGAPEPTYGFRHVLIQEATYSGVVRSERRQLHRRAAWALEALSAGRLEDFAAPLGRHFAAAGEPERASHYFEMAGDHAEAAFASGESEACFRAGLVVTDADSAARRERSKAGYKLEGQAGRRPLADRA